MRVKRSIGNMGWLGVLLGLWTVCFVRGNRRLPRRGPGGTGGGSCRFPLRSSVFGF